MLGAVVAPLLGQRVTMVILKPNTADGEQLAGLVAAGKVRPIVSRTLTLDDVPAALEATRLGQRPAGKQVVRIR
jgi:NADPH:quinone reductase-like Zn-dependent oxidoreductase